MKKKSFTLLTLCALASTVMVGAAGCASGGTKTDATKTQIYVNNFKRGFGGEWLDKLKTRYEALHAEDSFEEGKKGVQIVISNSGNPAESLVSSILNNRDEVYFTEQSSYFVLLQNNVLGDITEAVTTDLTEYGETRSIEDKMSEDQKNYFGVTDGEGTKYYALPHYSGYAGLSYDVDLFDSKNLYFAKAGEDSTSLDGHFIRNSSEEKTYGPDGKTGTIDGIDYSMDDGLPRTYDEFYLLCQYMVKKNVLPLCCNGQEAGGYLGLVLNSLAANNEGREQMNIIFKSEGTFNNLGTVSKDGTVSKMDPVTVDHDTGYKFSQMLGRYYASDFIEKLYRNNYIYENVDSSAYSPGDCQNDFLRSRIQGASQTNPIAMMAEGNWWENEASSAFTSLATRYGDDWSKESRRFAYMPLPKATQEIYDADQTNVLYDHLFSCMFMKANVSESKKPLIIDFIKFCNSDESLREFTATTNTMKALDYTLTDDDLSQMTYYGKSLYNLQKKSETVYPANGTSWFRDNSSFYATNNLYYSKPKGTNIQYVFKALQEGNSAIDIFNSMVTYYQAQWAYLSK